METLSGFDTLEHWIWSTLVALSILWALFVLGSYAKEILSWYLTKDGPESEQASSPDHITHVFGIGLLAVVWIFVFILSSLHASAIQGKYITAQKLAENSEIIGNPLHPDVRSLINAWPKIVESYQTSGEPGDYATTLKAFNETTSSRFVDPKDYVSIKTLTNKCFLVDKNLDKLHDVLSTYPASHKAFVDAWIRASLRNDYSTDNDCLPRHVFIMTGISRVIYNN